MADEIIPNTQIIPHTPLVGLKTPEGKIIDEIIVKTPGGDGRDSPDTSKLKHGRENHIGHKISNYLQSPPLLFTRDGHTVFLGDMYRGSSAFLIGGGPSFNKIDKEKLSQPGILTLGINNSVKVFRPNLWTSVDNPKNFIKSIWLDPKITKFVPFDHTEKTIFDNENWCETTTKVGECPNVFYYRRNEKFNADQFLFEDTFNWGNHKDYGGGRSVMLVAVRLLFYLGIRNVFMLGVDFNMDENTKYSFSQERTESSIKNNNSTYEKLNERFTILKPIFDKYEFNLYNCNPDSRLKVFPFMDFDEAVKIAQKWLPLDIKNERTDGLYDREAKLKEEAKNKPVVPGVDNNEANKVRTKSELDIARKALNDAKQVLSNYIFSGVVQEPDVIKNLENDIIEKRKVFRAKEVTKNLVWFGTTKRPDKKE